MQPTSSLRDTVLDIVKIRATNYRLTAEEFDRLFDHTYYDIMSTVTMKFDTYDTSVSKDNPGFTIDIDPSIEGMSKSISQIYEKKTRDNVTRYFIVKTNNEAVLDDSCSYLEWCGFFDFYGTPPNGVVDITVEYAIIPSWQDIPELQRTMLVPAMVEGILYMTESYIPSQGDTQVANISYQRYFNEKKRLLSLNPQGEW